MMNSGIQRIQRFLLTGCVVLAPALRPAPFSAPQNPTRSNESAGTDGEQAATSKPSLVSIPYPNLSNLDKVVQNQLKDAQSTLATTLHKADATKAELSRAYGEMGKLYQAYDLEDAAFACYLNAQALDPGSFEWEYYLGFLDEKKGDLAEAAIHFTGALRIRPNDETALLRMAQVLGYLNRSEEARQLFEKALTVDKSSALALAGLGKIALARQEYARAAEYFKQVLAIQPKASAIQYQLAMAYRGLGDLGQAEEHLRLRGPNQPGVPDPLIDGLENLKKGNKGMLCLRGTEAINTGHTAEAIQDFRELVALDPGDPTSKMYLGIALARSGDRQGAIEQYSAALQIAPWHAGVHYNLGVALIAMGSETEAIEHLRAATRSDPQLTRAHFHLANLLMRQRRDQEALPEYATVIRMEPRNAFARLMEAMALVRLKQYSEARTKLERGLAVSSDDPDLVTALARLLAGCPDKAVRDGQRALQLIQRVINQQKSFDLDQGQALAMALAAIGQFKHAAQVQRSIIGELEHAQRQDLVRVLRPNLALYEHDKPCLLPWQDDDPVFSPVPEGMGVTAEVLAPPTIMGDQSSGVKF